VLEQAYGVIPISVCCSGFLFGNSNEWVEPYCEAEPWGISLLTGFCAVCAGLLRDFTQPIFVRQLIMLFIEPLWASSWRLFLCNNWVILDNIQFTSRLCYFYPALYLFSFVHYDELLKAWRKKTIPKPWYQVEIKWPKKLWRSFSFRVFFVFKVNHRNFLP